MSPRGPVLQTPSVTLTPNPRQTQQLFQWPPRRKLQPTKVSLPLRTTTLAPSAAETIIVKSLPKASDFEDSQLSCLGTFWAERVGPVLDPDGKPLPVLPLTNEHIEVCNNFLQASCPTCTATGAMMQQFENDTCINIALKLESQQAADRGLLIATSRDLASTWERIIYISELSGQPQVVFSADSPTVPQPHSAIPDMMQDHEQPHQVWLGFEEGALETANFDPMRADNIAVAMDENSPSFGVNRPGSDIAEESDFSDESHAYSGDELDKSVLRGQGFGGRKATKRTALFDDDARGSIQHRQTSTAGAHANLRTGLRLTAHDYNGVVTQPASFFLGVIHESQGMGIRHDYGEGLSL